MAEPTGLPEAVTSLSSPFDEQIGLTFTDVGPDGIKARFTVTPGPIPPEMLTQVIGWFSDWR